MKRSAKNQPTDL